MTNQQILMMNLQLKESRDGSFTLYRQDIDETYHSIHGAIQEANHVFIESGLNPLLKKESELNVLEIGLGTGLNALLTWLRMDHFDQCSLCYTGIELYPVPPEINKKMEYGKIMGLEMQFQKLIDAPWEEKVYLSNNFQISKLSMDLMQMDFSNLFDLIYFDAFGPRAQGEMWSISNFEKLHEALKPNGVFVTYCAKGQVRRDLESVGFEMERIPGPPGKREMLRGIVKK